VDLLERKTNIRSLNYVLANNGSYEWVVDCVPKYPDYYDAHICYSSLWPQIFTARRYVSAVSAVYAMALCLSVSVISRCLLKWPNAGSHKENHTIAQGL